jgi:hypothetical protein
MRRATKLLVCVLVVAAAGLLATAPACATVLTVGQWRMGDDDSGAVSGNAVNGTGAAVVGPNLTALNGNSKYSSNTPGTLSKFSTTYNGVDTGYYSDTLPTTATDNFGMEAWVKAAGTTGVGHVAIAGASLTSDGATWQATGWGIAQVNGNFVGNFAGVCEVGSASVAVDTWQHVALVRDNGVATLYLNGVASGSSTSTPNTPQGPLTVGFQNVQMSGNREWFNGQIDQLRVFTFAGGQFNAATDLTLSLAVPEPSTITILITGVIGLLAYAWRKRK